MLAAAGVALQVHCTSISRAMQLQCSPTTPRFTEELKNTGADWALLSSLDNVTYTSHFAVPIDFGATATLTLVPPLHSVNGENLRVLDWHR